MQRRLLIALCAILAGCADTKPAAPPKPVAPAMVRQAAPPPPASAPAAPAPSPTSLLTEGIALYEKGDYNGAIRRLAQSNVPTAPKATQLTALKYTAFSYCLTSRQTLCRQQFEKALKLDPRFELEPGEKGHPLWGRAWVKAKKGKV